MRAFIEAQGSLLHLQVRGAHSRPPVGGGLRQNIYAFSRASRRRLLQFMARLKTRKIRATFVTLTFKGCPSAKEAKEALKRFTMRVRRKFEEVSGVWRMEYQERGSIHFHMLMFNLPFWKQAELQATWEKCTREEMSRADIRLVHGTRMVMSYISKYIAKVDQGIRKTSLVNDAYQHDTGESSAGRFWGYINKELLPLGEVKSGVLTDDETIRRLSEYAWEIVGSDDQYGNLSFHLFSENAILLCENAIDEGGMEMDDWISSTQFTEREWRDIDYIANHFSDAELETPVAQPKPIIGRPSVARLVQPSILGWLCHAEYVPA